MKGGGDIVSLMAMDLVLERETSLELKARTIRSGWGFRRSMETT